MSKIKICLDAGHVGSKYNQSPVVKTYYESAMVWKLHLKLKAELETRGFEVITTRADIDTDLGVYKRGAASKGCNVFISLHSNACSTESVDYPVVYRAYDNLNDVGVLALQIAKKIGELMGTNQAGRTATRKNSAGGEYYGVLRGARAVGTPFYMLIEHSFHTNTAATKWLSVDANLDKLAVAEAELLADYFGINDTPKTEIMGEAHAHGTADGPLLQEQERGAQADELHSGAARGNLPGGRQGRGRSRRRRLRPEPPRDRLLQVRRHRPPKSKQLRGIGALNGNATGQAATFPDPRTGVRAQIQHLKAYASTEPLVNTCVDPRFSLVTRGSAPYVEWLGAADNPNGKGWAVPGSGYGANVVKLLGQIMAQEAPGSPSPAPEPDPLANYPDWQRNGLTALVKAGVINSPDYWANKFGEAIKVGEIIGILGKMMEQPTE